MSADTTSETWVGSPLYVAMVDALADCGLSPVSVPGVGAMGWAGVVELLRIQGGPPPPGRVGTATSGAVGSHWRINPTIA